MDPSADTIDLKEEIDDLDSLLNDGAMGVADRSRRSSRIEQVLLAMANTIWAILGLVLWLPQALRAVLSAALRTVHAALTHQPSGRAIAGIQRVSRFYVDRFLRGSGQAPTTGRRQELRPFRLLLEFGWAAVFYLVVLRWLHRPTFDRLWEVLERAAGSVAQRVAAMGTASVDFVSGNLAGLEMTDLQIAGSLVVTSAIGVLLGVWLGRRR